MTAQCVSTVNYCCCIYEINTTTIVYYVGFHCTPVCTNNETLHIKDP